MVDKKAILKALEENFDTRGTVTIDDHGQVTCEGTVSFKTGVSRFPVQFEKVTNGFDCGFSPGLTSLEGAPREVGGTFYCANTGLTSLAGAPKKVGDFVCRNNLHLRSLEGAPETVEGNFVCDNNHLLTTLEGGPKQVLGTVRCFGNARLVSLLGAPETVEGDFVCDSNHLLTTLEGGPKQVLGIMRCTGNARLVSLLGAPTTVGGDFWCHDNPKLRSLEGLPSIPGILYLTYKQKLPLLRCLLAQQVVFYPRKQVSKPVQTIVNRYAGQGEAGAFSCGTELATAGYKENARW